MEALILARSAALGFTRRRIEADEMVDRLVLPLVDEGARILAEGIAARPGDIDVVWIHGYGFPAWRGGPMVHAAARGFGAIVERLDALARINPALAPSDALRALVRAAAPGIGAPETAAR